MNDELILIKECVKANPKAQQKLFEKYAPKMMTVALRYVKNTQEAEDILQDGFVKIFSKIKDFQSEGSFEGWIRRIIVNCALDQLRKNKKFQQDVAVEDVDFRIRQDAFIEEGLMAEDLLKLIQEMPDGYKVVFNMFAIEGYSHKDIADTLGISENTSKSQYSRARQYMRNQLEKLENVRER